MRLFAAEPPDSTTDMHFGGFLTKNDGGTAKHLSGKDVMDEIVAKSKLQRVKYYPSFYILKLGIAKH
jgi:hypothetical protein